MLYSQDWKKTSMNKLYVYVYALLYMCLNTHTPVSVDAKVAQEILR